jgi:hypothetical protein
MVTLTPGQSRLIHTILDLQPPTVVNVYGGPGCAKSSTLAYALNDRRHTRPTLYLVFNREAKRSMEHKIQITNVVRCATYAGLAWATPALRTHTKDIYAYRLRTENSDGSDDSEDEETDHTPVAQAHSFEYVAFVEWLHTTDGPEELNDQSRVMWDAIVDGSAPIDEKATFKLLLLSPDVRNRVFGAYEVIVWDEAQDMNAVQWALCDALRREGRHVQIMAGDPFQCINVWAGAVFRAFLPSRGVHDQRPQRQELTLASSFRLSGAALNATNSLARLMRSYKRDLPRSLIGLVSGNTRPATSRRRHHGYLDVHGGGMMHATNVIRYLERTRPPPGQGYLFFRTNKQLWIWLLDNYKSVLGYKARYPELVVQCDPKKFRSMERELELYNERRSSSGYIDPRQLRYLFRCVMGKCGNHCAVANALDRIREMQATPPVTPHTSKKRKLTRHDPRQTTLFGSVPPWSGQIELLCTTVHTQKGRERTFSALMGDLVPSPVRSGMHVPSVKFDEHLRVIFVALSRCTHHDGLLVPTELACRLNSITSVREVLRRTPAGSITSIVDRIHDYIGYTESLVPTCRVTGPC